MLPTGTVTFLFTDIEGSTKLWAAQPEVMRVALAWNDALLLDQRFDLLTGGSRTALSRQQTLSACDA